MAGEQGGHGPFVAGVDALGVEPVVAVERGDGGHGTGGVVVGDHQRLEERTAGGDPGDGGAHTAGAHEQDTHDENSLI